MKRRKMKLYHNVVCQSRAEPLCRVTVQAFMMQCLNMGPQASVRPQLLSVDALPGIVHQKQVVRS